MKNKKGFTLIEMMVVVLILAGLAAIAYPVYSKAIMKARLSEAFSLAEIVREAQQRSLAVDGDYFTQFSTAHATGRTRLIKGNGVTVSGGVLRKGLYIVSMKIRPNAAGNKTLDCIKVEYGQDSSNPVFTIYTNISDSRIWCTEADNGNGICGTIPSLEEWPPECEEE